MHPVLVFGFGNPSRGDDALGPEFLRLLERERKNGKAPDSFDIQTDFQLQVEHVLDLEGRELVLFVDASISASSPFEFEQLVASRDSSYTTHAMSPAALMSVFEEVCSTTAPQSFLLAINGCDFELGNPLSQRAQENLSSATEFTVSLLARANPEYWSRMTRHYQPIL